MLQGGKHQAHLFGLKPFTTYHVHVVAVNNAGQVSSPWTSVRTLEASPSGLSNFTVEKKENGRALLLKWSEPSEPNGIIKVISVFAFCLIKKKKKKNDEHHLFIYLFMLEKTQSNALYFKIRQKSYVSTRH